MRTHPGGFSFTQLTDDKEQVVARVMDPPLNNNRIPDSTFVATPVADEGGGVCRRSSTACDTDKFWRYPAKGMPSWPKLKSHRSEEGMTRVNDLDCG